MSQDHRGSCKGDWQVCKGGKRKRGRRGSHGKGIEKMGPEGSDEGAHPQGGAGMMEDIGALYRHRARVGEGSRKGRARPDQTVRLSWGPVNPLSLLMKFRAGQGRQEGLRLLRCPKRYEWSHGVGEGSSYHWPGY